MEEGKTARVSIPLTPYDIFNYLIPGCVLVVCIVIFDVLARSLSDQHILKEGHLLHTPISNFLFSYSLGMETPWALQAILLGGVIATCYVFGHIIATVSSLTIERLLVYKGYGYPYEALLNIPSYDKNRQCFTDFSRYYYKGLAFWLLTLCLLFYYRISISNTHFNLVYVDVAYVNTVIRFAHRAISAVSHGWFLILLYVIGFSFYKLANSNNRALGNFWESKKNEHLISDKVRLMRNWFCGPYELLCKFLALYLSTRNQYNKCFIDRYKKKFEDEFGMDPQLSKTNNFWFSLLFVRENSESLGKSVDNWLRLSGFARNLATAFFFSFLYGLGYFLWQGKKIANWDHYTLKMLVFVPVVYFVIFIFMLFRFYYIYVHYYTKFVFRSFVYLDRKPDKP